MPVSTNTILAVKTTIDLRLRNCDWKRCCDINSNAYKPREALRVRLKTLIFDLCDSFAGKLKALQEIQPAFQTQYALFSVKLNR